MGLKFRKSVKMGPVRVNLSKSGIGYSVGTKGLRVTKKAGGGTRTTVGIPGTGISYSSGSQKKALKKSKNHTDSKTYSQASTSGCGGGCLKGVGWTTLICLGIGLFQSYWRVLVLIAVAVIVGYIAYRACRKGHPAESTDPDSTEKIEELPDVQESSFETRRKEKILEFHSELETIPRTEIKLSEAAPRQLLKNLPEYAFSNITRKTRTDSIFPLVFLDVETTGFAPSKCEILEVSAIKFESGMIPVSAFTTLCKPNKPIPEETIAINHITEEMVATAPTFGQVAQALTEYLKGCNIAGHNLDFDLRFIYAHGTHLPENVRFYDTLDLAHLTIKESSVYNYKLDTVCHYYGIWRDDSHRSLSDCYATAKLFARLVQDKTSRQLEADGEIISEINAE